MSEKTEKATPYRLQKTKEKGQVSKSNELTICVLFLLLLGLTTAMWPLTLQEVKALMVHLFRLATTLSFSNDVVSHLQQTLLLSIIHLWLPFAFVVIFCIIISTVVQTGFIWSTQALTPDFRRLNMQQNLKRLISSKTLFEAIKNSLKIALACLLMVLSIHHELPLLMSLQNHWPIAYPALFMRLFSKLGLQLIGLLSFFALIDSRYTRWKWAKNNRMSKEEVQDEYRQREGDPKIKVKIKQLQQQLRQKAAAFDHVKTADVVITNPTHLAVALKYQRHLMPAPQVVCKAQGELAKQIRLVAQRHHIPIINNKPFARALFSSVALNQWIRQEHFPTAAMIFSDLYRQRGLIV